MTRTHLAAALAATLFLLPTPSARAADIDPISCWWRTSTPAIRVGQPFDVVLTCAVVETADATVVPDEAKLDPAAAQFPPFEVLGGRRGPDQRNSVQRFLQYTYTLRLITDDAFGRDATMTIAPLSYRIDTKAASDAVQGRNKTYRMPALSVRVLSLVPAEATSPRAVVSDSFAAIDQRSFRARSISAVGNLFFAFAGALLIGVVVQLVRRVRAAKTSERRDLVIPRLVLLATLRELTKVARDAQGGWTDELTARGAAAARIAAAYALGLPVSQARVTRMVAPQDGQIAMPWGPLLRSRVLISAPATAEALSQGAENRASRLPGGLIASLQNAVSQLTAARYGRDGADSTTLSAAVDEAASGTKRLLVQPRVIRPRRVGQIG